MNPDIIDPSLVRLVPVLPKLAPELIETTRNGLDPNRAELKKRSGLSEATLKNFAKEFNDVAEKYADISPFKKNIFQKLSELCNRFARWLFGKKPPFPVSDLELKFSQNLFRTLDDLPAEKVDKNREQLPFSFVLNSWSKVIKALASPLKSCAYYQKAIEDIRESSWFRESRLALLRKKMASDIDHLKPGEQLLLPGGFNPLIAKGLIEKLVKHLVTEEKDKKMIEEAYKLLTQIPMVYEVRKNANGQLSFSVFHESILFHLGLDKMGDDASGVQMLINLIENIKDPSKLLSKKEGIQLAVDNMDQIADFGKMENGQFELNPKSLKPFFDLGLRGSPSRTYTITPELLKNSLNDLLFAQVFAHKIESLGFFGKIKYALGKLLALKKEKDKEVDQNQKAEKDADRIINQLENIKGTSFEKVVEDYSLLKVFRVFREFRKKTPEGPNLSELKVKLHLKAQTEKTLEVFTKVHDIASHKMNKLLLKTAVFLDIFHKTESHLADPAWRRWIKDTGFTLLKSVEKQFCQHNGIVTELGPDSAFRKQFDQILTKIEAAEENEQITLPHAPSKQKKVKPNFSDEPMVIDRSSTKMSSLKKVKPRSQKDKKLNTLSFADGFEVLKRLAAMGDLEALNKNVNDLYSMLFKADRENKWKTLSAEECSKWSEDILQLGMLQFRIHFGKKHSGLRPLQILQMLRSQEIVQKLCHLHESSNHFKGFRIDTYPYREILKDAYLDLGIYTHEIFETLNRIEAIEGAPVTLGSSAYNKKEGELNESLQDRKFIDHLIDLSGKTNTLEERAAYFKDFGSGKKLPRQIVHLRKISILSQVLMARYLSLHCSSFKMVTLDAWSNPQVRDRDGTLIERDFRKSYRAKLLQEIDSRVYKLDQPGFIPSERSVILALGLNFHNYNSLGWLRSIHLYDIVYTFQMDPVPHESLVPSIYEDIGEEVATKSIRDRLFDGCIVQKYDSYNPYVKEDGRPIRYDDSKERDNTGKLRPEYFAKGKCQGERTILDEREFRFPGLPYDVSAELQLIQTDPERTRVQNTIGCLVKHCRLLNDPEHGAEFQRFFTTNLFRNGWLYRHLMQNPAYTTIVVKELERLFSTLSISRQYWGALRVMQLTERCHDIIQQLVKLSKKPAHPKDITVIEEYTSCWEIISSNNEKHYKRKTPKILPKFVKPGFTDLLEKNCTKLADICAENYKTLSAWQKKTNSDTEFQSERLRIHHAYLVYHANRFMKKFYFSNLSEVSTDPVINGALQNILYSYTMKKRTAASIKEINPEQDEAIEYLMAHLASLIKKQLEDKTVRNSWLWELVPVNLRPSLEKRGSWEPDTEYPIFACGNYRLDLSKGLFYDNHIALCPFPAEITNDVVCQKLFGANLFRIEAQQWQVARGPKIGTIYEFKDASSQLYRVVLLQGEKPLIYKSIAKKWFQHHELAKLDKVQDNRESSKFKKELNAIGKTTTHTIPFDLAEKFVWISDGGNKFLVEDQTGKVIYHGILSQKYKKEWRKAASKSTLNHLRCIEFIREIPNAQNLLDPWKDKSFRQLLALDNPHHIEVTGTNGKAERIKYTKLGLGFCWNAQQDRWDCETYKGYYLSKKCVKDILKTQLFASSFRNYLILESEHKPPLILLSGEPYQATSNKSSWSKNVHKHAEPNRACPSMGLYVYTVDPVKGIQTTQLLGYRYLAYQLFIQGKHRHAIAMLKMSQGLNPADSDPIDQWFDKWNSNTIASKAVILQLEIMNLEQFMIRGRNHSDPAGFKKHLTKIAGLYAIYKAAALKGILAPQLQMKDNDEINFLAILSNYSDFLKSLLDQLPRNPELAHSYASLQQLAHAITVATSNLNLEMLQLDSLIAANALRQKGITFVDEANFKPIPLFSSLDEFLTSTPENTDKVPNQLQKQTQEFSNALKRKLGSKFSGAYGDKLAAEISTDVEDARKKKAESTFQLNTAKVQLLNEKLEREKNLLAAEVLMHRNAIEAFFPKEQLDINALKQYQRRVRRPDSNKDSLFRTVISCYSTNDWTNAKWLRQDQIQQMDQAIEDYLIQATRLQQLEKAIVALHDYTDSPTDVKSELCARLLTQKRQYDPKTHHFRRAILPLEYDSQIIIRENQKYNVHEICKNNNLFMHQALADGKTTVTRQIISKVTADGVHGAGVMTHAPLIEMHHALLGKTANHAYGDLVYRLEFNRKDPSNALALNNILRNIKKMIAYGGRIDKTNKTLLSLHHAFILKMDALLTANEENEKKLQEELDILSDIFTLLHEKCKDTTDEIDEILNVEKEHNYSIGNKISLDENRIDAGLEIMQWTLNSTVDSKFKSNKQYKMEESDIKKYLSFIAEKVQQKYCPNSDSNLVVQYLTGLDSTYDLAKLNKFYTDVIDIHPDRNKLVAFYKYLRLVLPGTFKRRGGVDFMRSSDGLLVKPVEKIGKAAEHSERGTEEETIWYTCLNYMDSSLGGVTRAQIEQLISSKKSKAAKEVLSSQRNGKAIRFEDTSPAKEFKKQFARYKLELQNLTQSDLQKIVDAVNTQPDLLSEFLKDHVFSQIKITPEKIVGTPTDAVEIPKEFSGSSGTKNSYLTLPDKIQKIEKYAKQKGSDGAVLLALIKDYKKGDILPYNDQEDPTVEIAKQLKPGSAFIDLAPAYPGLSSLGIARKFAALKPGVTFRFIDSDDRVKIIRNAFEEPVLAGEDLNLSEIITIFDKDHTRGTNLVLGTDIECFTTISPKTHFSEFLQAVMRARKLGQGQKIRYFIDNKSIEMLGKDPSLESVVALVIENEEKALQNIHFKAEKQKIKGVAKTRLFRALYTLGNHNNRTNKAELYALRKNLWKHSPIREYFIQKTSDDLSQLGKPEQIQKPHAILQKMTNHELTNMQTYSQIPIIRDNPILNKAVLDADTTLKKRKLIPEEFLPSGVYDTREDQDQAQEVEREQEQEQAQEQQQEQEVEQDQEQEQELSSHKTLRENNYLYFDVETLPQLIDKMKDAGRVPQVNLQEAVYVNRDYVKAADSHHEANQKFSRMNDFIPFYDPQIVFTRNFMETRIPPERLEEFWQRQYGMVYTTPWGTQKIEERLPPYQKPIQRFSIIVDKRNNQVHALLGSAKDFDNVLEELDNKPHPDIDYYIYNLYRDDLDGRQIDWNNYPSEIQEKIAGMIVQIKFFNGEIDLIKPEKAEDFCSIRNEYDAFKKWLMEISAKEGRPFLITLEANLKKYLKEWRPSILPDYPSSTMARAFREALRVRS